MVNKVMLLADATSPHTIKWARSLSERGISICIVSFTLPDPAVYSQYPLVQVVSLGFDNKLIKSGVAGSGKWRYLTALPKVRWQIKQFKPNIVHAHFASSYGLLGALSGFSPFILSVWGTDVYEFPRKSLLHKAVIKFNLARADKLLSTSHDMARETWLYTNKPITVTPFGIDTDFFKPGQKADLPFSSDDLVIGNVKGFDRRYGVTYLIEAFALLVKQRPALPLKLLLLGDGADHEELQQQIKALGLMTRVHFAGRVPYDQMPAYHNAQHISACVSLRESFGVAVIEAGACEVPVVATRVGGLPEVVQHGQTGLLVSAGDASAIKDALLQLVDDAVLRSRMGRAARQLVQQHFDWQGNVSQMHAIYQQLTTELSS